jgi:hypothetical protein
MSSGWWHPAQRVNRIGATSFEYVTFAPDAAITGPATAAIMTTTYLTTALR